MPETRASNVSVGFFGDEVDRATDGIAAAQRALRAFEHLDPIDPDQVLQLPAGAPDIDAVHERADRGFRSGVERPRADAAQIDVGRDG